MISPRKLRRSFLTYSRTRVLSMFFAFVFRIIIAVKRVNAHISRTIAIFVDYPRVILIEHNRRFPSLCYRRGKKMRQQSTAHTQANANSTAMSRSSAAEVDELARVARLTRMRELRAITTKTISRETTTTITPRGRLPMKDRIALVRLWHRHDGDVREILREWRLENETVDSPRSINSAPMTGRLIRATAQRFHEIGTVRDRARSGRKRTVRTDPTIERVRDSIVREPMLSTRKRARLLGISRSSLMRIQRWDLHAKPYKLQIVHQLLPVDTIQRRVFCQKFLRLIAEADALSDPDAHDDRLDDSQTMVNRLIMGDEAHFDLTSAVFNRQNVRFWGTENPRLWRPQALHSARVTVWCGFSSVGVLGPYFFETPDGKARTVTGERYREMLRDYVTPLLRDDPRFNAVRDWWWQQNGATAHTARDTMNVLRDIFGADRIISRGSAFVWPSRSPDLSAPDFFLWGYLKDRVYRVESDALSASTKGPYATPRTIADLKQAIVREIEYLNEPERDELRRSVMNNLVDRARMCVRARGRHLLDIVYHA